MHSEIARIIRTDRGITLVEIIVVLAISALLLVAVYAGYLVQHKTSNVQHQIMTIQQDLRALADIMERDIRMSGCDPTGYSTAGIIVGGTNANALFVSMDLDGDGDTGDTDEQAAYARNSTTVTRNGQSLVQGITTMGFIYLDGNNAAIAPPITSGNVDNIRTVRITLWIQSEQRDPDTGQFLTRTLSRRVRCRNLGF